MVAPIHVQFFEASAAKVRILAALEQRSVADTVGVLVEEGFKAREFPDLITADGPTGRRATLIAGPDLFAGKDWQALRASYPELDEADLRAAIRYYEAYPEEIEARVAFNMRSIVEADPARAFS